MTLISQKSVGCEKSVRLSLDAISLQWRRNRQSTIAPVRCSCKIFFLRHEQLFWNVPYKRDHMTENIALLMIWKKTPSSILVYVSKTSFNFLSVFLQPNWQLGWLFVEFLRSNIFRHIHTNTQPNTHTHTHTHTPCRIPSNEWLSHRIDLYLHTNNKQRGQIYMLSSVTEHEIPVSKPLLIYS